MAPHIRPVSFLVALVLTLVTQPSSRAQSVDVELVGQIGGSTYACAIQGNYVYIGVGPRLVILDISQPANPAFVAQTDLLSGVVRGVSVAGNYAYVADGYAGLRIINVSNPSAPFEAGSYDTLGSAEDVAVAGNYVYVADTDGGLVILATTISQPPAVTITRPCCGESVVCGTTFPIEWTATTITAPNWRFTLLRNGSFYDILSLNPVSHGAGRWHADWNVPLTLRFPDTYVLRIEDTVTYAEDESGPFSVTTTCSLVWWDEFHGTSLDINRWEPMIGDGTLYEIPAGWGNHELQYYTDRPANVLVADGNLHIVARHEPYEGYEYTSARIRSYLHADFLYGRLEARIRIPSTQGIWPAFWMLATGSEYGYWPASGEIDIMESVNTATTVYGTLHYGGPTPQEHESSGSMFCDCVFPCSCATPFTFCCTDYSEAFHTYAIEWEPDVIRWYVDQVLYGAVTSDVWWSASAPDNPRAPFDQPFHFLLNVAVGGDFPGPPNPASTFPQEMIVDWVRVYDVTPDFCPNAPFATGDPDGDGDVDRYDWIQFVACASGTPQQSECEHFDFDADGAVDLRDFRVFQALFEP